MQTGVQAGFRSVLRDRENANFHSEHCKSSLAIDGVFSCILIFVILGPLAVSCLPARTDALIPTRASHLIGIVFALSFLLCLGARQESRGSGGCKAHNVPSCGAKKPLLYVLQRRLKSRADLACVKGRWRRDHNSENNRCLHALTTASSCPHVTGRGVSE